LAFVVTLLCYGSEWFVNSPQLLAHCNLSVTKKYFQQASDTKRNAQEKLSSSFFRAFAARENP
jgi:hypothetical protein